MNYDVSNENLPMCNLDFEGCQEVPIDLDFSLPDYCPDIQKILKCRVVPNITSRNISGDRLNVEGSAIIRIIYLNSENKTVRCCENSTPFSVSADIKNTPENGIALTFAKSEYVNCRAVSPRKVDIHGALSVCFKIYNKSSKQISCFVTGKDIQQKIDTVPTDVLTGIGQQQFSLNEVLDIENFSDQNSQNNKSGGISSPEIIMNSDVTLTLNDYKVMPNKVVVKGEAVLKILYMDDLSTGNLETVEYTIPVSQIVDVPGADENSKYVLMGEVLSHEEQIQTGNSDVKNMISSEIKIAATVMAYQEKEIGVVSDVYSTESDLAVHKETIELAHLKNILNEDYSQKSSVDISETNALKIIDVWPELPIVSTSQEGSGLKFKVKINLCILAINSDNVPFYIERITEFTQEKTIDDSIGKLNVSANLVPSSIGYSLSPDGVLNVKINGVISGTVFEFSEIDMITSVESDESQPKNKQDDVILTVYYADEGENLWDIARKYYTSVDAIKQENNISEDTVIKKGMILIPLK